MIKRSLLLSLLLATGAVQAQDKTAAQPDLAKAKLTAEQICGACHGADGNSQIPANPKLAGQHAEYLYKQLRNFKGENGQPAERNNGIMAGMVAGLSDADMKGLAAHFSSQTLKPEVAKNKDSITLGQKLWRAGDVSRGIPACAACHGPAGAGLPAQYPRLAGQFAEYTETQLKSFRAGERANDPNKMMRTIALKMTDPEIKAVADYAAGLR
ncbi:c-type cytochrome [Zoogloea sp.]|uniref:c-type cytochrome n=1 Tax=Zoogloea sp. TaxID=49181 RepID=UPI00262C28B4|nr:c-type cytochrome [Zoogloea sp.]MDD3352731.1 c-type cytochrome [Zoogloea sp.]